MRFGAFWSETFVFRLRISSHRSKVFFVRLSGMKFLKNFFWKIILSQLGLFTYLQIRGTVNIKFHFW